MSSWTCGEVCAEVTWTHVESQLLVAAIPWTVLVFSGCALSCYLPYSEAGSNARQRFIGYQYGFSSSSSGATLAIIFVHLVQCMAFAVRSARRGVDQIYFGLEVLGTLFVCLDVAAAWTFVVSNGLLAVIAASLGQFLLDCLVLTSVVGLTLERAEMGRTWFSFSFLGGLRLVRIIHFLLEDNLSSLSKSSGWRRQVLYHVMQIAIYVYVLAAAIMTFELLGSPKATLTSWDLGSSLVFAFSTLLTVGDATMAPQTIIGQIIAIGLMIWTCKFIATKVYPLVRLWLFGGAGRGYYSISWWRKRCGHIVLSGSPTASMLMDFIEELYHENHFDSEEAMEKSAVECVVLLPDEKTCILLRQMLKRRSCLRFRDRVVILLGELFNPNDTERVDLERARRAFVLPNLTTLDVSTDDRQNIMRTFALSHSAPHVEVTCLLHRSEFDLSTLSSAGSKSTFLSIEDTKLNLMGSACLTRGALSLVCNLCRSLGGRESPVPWQNDYQRSLGIELYQVPLSMSYHGCQFSEVVEDVMNRSVDGDVYLIGIIELDRAKVGAEAMKVTMHPGGLHVMDLQGGAVSGVFMAPSISAIIQADPNEEPSIKSTGRLMSQMNTTDSSWGSRPRRDSDRGQHVHFEDGSDSDTNASPDSKVLGKLRALADAPDHLVDKGVPQEPEPLHREQTPHGVASSRTGKSFEGKAARVAIEESLGSREHALVKRAEASKDPKAPPAKNASRIAMERAADLERKQKMTVQQYAVDGYESAVRNIRNRLLARGVGADVVAGVTIPEEAINKYKIKQVSALELVQSEERSEKKDQSSAHKKDDNISPVSSPRSPKLSPRLARMQSMMSADEGEQLELLVEELRRLEDIHKRVEAARRRSLDVPQAVLDAGGHLMLCVVGDSTGHSSSSTRKARFGPKLFHFLRPLIHREQKDMKGSQVSRSLIILGEELPADWNRILDVGSVYFVRGSPLQLRDLEKTAFKKASAIAIMQAHGSSGAEQGKVSDAQVILAAGLIEANMPKINMCNIITDHVYKGSCELLPNLLKALMERPPETEEGWFAGDSMEAFKWGLSSTKARPPEESAMLRPPQSPEDFEELGACNYTYHPRYMRGQVFTSSIMTTLMATSMYNDGILSLVDALVQAPMLVLPVPAAVTQKAYGDFARWLLMERNILAIGLYRSAAGAEADAEMKPVDESKPTFYYVFAAPPARNTRLVKTDQVICLVPAVGHR